MVLKPVQGLCVVMGVLALGAGGCPRHGQSRHEAYDSAATRRLGDGDYGHFRHGDFGDGSVDQRGHGDAGYVCLANSECADGVPCTNDVCIAGECTQDDSACECDVDGDCNDQIDATLDLCDAEDRSCTSKPISYTNDVQALFQSKCGPCHEGETECAGRNRCFITSHVSLREPASSPQCVGMSVAECVQLRVREGSMPPRAGCTGDPVLDANMSACLTAREQGTLEAWLAAGAP